MSKIHSIKIKNFKGIKTFEQCFNSSDFICIIGRGDSSKTTILEAISLVLSPNWNISFYDTDFYNLEIENPIEIEVTLINLPDKLIRDDKFGLNIRGVKPNDNAIYDDIDDSLEAALTIKLEVCKDLEPKWFVINSRLDKPVPISSTDRSSFGVFLISDYLDKHFTWNQGSPLYTLFKEYSEKNKSEHDIIIDALREAKTVIDNSSFDSFNIVNQLIKSSSTNIGIDINQMKNTIDIKDLLQKEGRLCLHDEKIPFRLKGKGAKRLISIAIQLALVNSNGIILIDEIEQGLEPDRVQHLIHLLKIINCQFIITTHSRDVLVELEPKNIFLKTKNSTCLKSFSQELQGCIRNNPEAFFAERIIVCEGPTEIGICRAINEFRIKNNKESIAFKGIRFANGVGSNLIEYAKGFKQSSFDVCLFCDSDVPYVNNKKAGLTNSGIKVVDCDLDKSTEQQIINDLPWLGVKKLIEYQILQQDSISVFDSIKERYKKYGNLDIDTYLNTDIPNLREVIGLTAKKNSWFKRIDHGQFLGSICCEYLTEMQEKKTKLQFDEIINWIGND